MGALTAEYFNTVIGFDAGEEIKEVINQGQYLDKATHQAKSCYLVFTNVRMLIYIDVPVKKGLFKKKSEPVAMLGYMPYEDIDHLEQATAQGNDSFCKAVMKNGGECIFCVFGSFFGPLAKKVCEYSGKDIPRKRK